MQKYSPFVYWAQTESSITLRIDLRNVKFPSIKLEVKRLEFTAIGVGAQGEAQYAVQMNLNQPINSTKSKFCVKDRQVDFNLVKETSGFWPRLLEEQKRPVWLKIDFDKFMHEEDLEDEAADIMDHYPDLFDKLKREELGWGEKLLSYRESLKKAYMFIYNLWQFVGFLYIISVIAVRYLKNGPESMEQTYEAVSWMLKLCFTLQFLEVLHPIVGYTKGSPVEPFIQASGRALIFFCLIVCEPRMQTKPVVFYIFSVWSLIELIRYPYYMLRVYDVEIGFITWLRYTAWIIMYPTGFLLEGNVILRSIPYIVETEAFTISMPNKWNFTFHFATFLRLYLLLFFFPAMYKMMSHMYQQRVKKIGPKPIKKKLQ